MERIADVLDDVRFYFNGRFSWSAVVKAGKGEDVQAAMGMRPDERGEPLKTMYRFAKAGNYQKSGKPEPPTKIVGGIIDGRRKRVCL